LKKDLFGNKTKEFRYLMTIANTVISGHLPAQQITRTGRFLPKGEKRFSRLPALADNPHPKTKESHAK